MLDYDDFVKRLHKKIHLNYKYNAIKALKDCYVNEYQIKIFSFTDRELEVKPLFSKKTSNAIYYYFAVFDGIKSLATGYIKYKNVRRD